jgi:hypothetical protein
LDILTMHLPINFKSPNNISKWQMGFNSAFKGVIQLEVDGIIILKWMQPCVFGSTDFRVMSRE